LRNLKDCSLLWLLRILLGVLTAILFAAAPETSFGQNLTTSAKSDDESDQFPHPWILDSPPTMSRLIDVGHVRILVDDTAVLAEQRSALTLFFIRIQHQMRFRIRSVTKDSQGRRDAVVLVKFISPSVLVEHEIRLLGSYRPVKPWESMLLLHEMDHVAISSDPRLLKLLKGLLYSPTTLRISLPDGSEKDQELIQEAIEKRLTVKLEAIRNIVREYYLRLDDQSNHGLKDLKIRRDFFAELYTWKDLESLKFPYLSEVKTLVSSKDSNEVEKHYLLETSD